MSILIKGGTVIGPTGPQPADVLVAGTATFRGGAAAYADNIRGLRG